MPPCRRSMFRDDGPEAFCWCTTELTIGRGSLCDRVTRLALGVFAPTAVALGWAVERVPPPTAPSGNLTSLACPAPSFCLSVGSREDATGDQVALAERWNGRTWSVQRVPGEPLAGLSCISGSACVAVGSDGVDRWNGRAWTWQRVAPKQSSIEFSGSSCWNARGCMVVGTNLDRGYEGAPVAELWNGQRWHNVRPLVNGDGFLAVSCLSATFCMAVGATSTDSGDGEVTFAERWNGRRWRSEPTLDAGYADELDSVVCKSTSTCTAVGHYENYAGSRPMVERWSGGRWSFQLVARPPAAKFGEFSSVVCRNPTDCTAVGGVEINKKLSLGLVERWSNSKWRVVSTGGSTHSLGTNLIGVSCPSITQCVAVGTGETSRELIASRSSGGRWSRRNTPNPLGPLPSELNDVSCSSLQACLAVGRYYPSGSSSRASMPFAEAWNGTTWTVQSVPTPTGTTNAELDAVSCPSPGSCTAIGQYATRQANRPPLIELLAGGRWTIQDHGHLTGPLSRVSCASATTCVAIGSLNSRMIAAIEDGSGWRNQNPSLASGMSLQSLGGVSCGSSTDCFAVGGVYVQTSGTNQTLVLRHAASGWSLQTSPDATRVGGFSDVSCTAPTECTAVGGDSPGPLAERWDGASWTIQTLAAGLDSASSLQAVSCGSATACTAINGLDAESWDGTSWHHQTLASRRNTNITRISCYGQAACVAVGSSTQQSSGLQLPFVERRS